MYDKGPYGCHEPSSGFRQLVCALPNDSVLQAWPVYYVTYGKLFIPVNKNWYKLIVPVYKIKLWYGIYTDNG